MKIQMKALVLSSVLVALLMTSCGGDKAETKDGSETAKDSAKVEKVVAINSADVPGAKIAWANSDSVAKYYSLANELRKNLEEQKIAAQSTLEGMYGQFEKKQKALEKEAPILGQTELQQKYQALQMLEQEILQKEQMLQQELSQNEYSATTGYINLTNEFMQKIGQKLGYDYVISFAAGGQLMYGNPAFDITDEIISELNAAYKNHGDN
jgi:Skp family chaperone for outer membrane proteins